MKIFISHSSKDESLANTLSSFLESINNCIEVFCSSQIGSIKVGRDFVHEITKELNQCNVFIPLLSTNYYESRFCMIELGFSYSCLCNKTTNSEGDYLYPLAVTPIKKEEALANTPLARLQTCSINDVDDMRAFIETICEGKNIPCVSGLNKRIHSFVYDVNRILFKSFDIISNSKIFLCKSGNVVGEDRDYLDYSLNIDGCGYTVNFRAKPFEHSTMYADFLSFVFKYIDKIDLYNLLNVYENAKLSVEINNYTNSIRKIDLEIKYSDNNNILHKQTFLLTEGINSIDIELKSIRSEALKRVSEICFVITPSAYIEDEGMFQIKNLRISF